MGSFGLEFININDDPTLPPTGMTAGGLPDWAPRIQAAVDRVRTLGGTLYFPPIMPRYTTGTPPLVPVRGALGSQLEEPAHAYDRGSLHVCVRVGRLISARRSVRWMTSVVSGAGAPAWAVRSATGPSRTGENRGA